jgi:thiol-disulfide isomerase/thioredoxin
MKTVQTLASLLVTSATMVATSTAFAEPPPATTVSEPASKPAPYAGREVKLSADAKAVLDRAGAAYHALKTYQDLTEVETLFVVKAANGDSSRMPSRKSTRFAYAGPRRFTLRGDSASVYGHDGTFTNQIRTGRDEKGQPTEEKEIIKLAPEGPVDWADCMGNLAQMSTPTPIHALLMTGPGSALDIFIEASKVEPGELDERPGTWVVGKGVCPYTYGSTGGGQDVTPIRAWFSAKTGLLREIRYDISRTSWALSAAESFGGRHGGGGTVDGTVTVRISQVAVDEPLDESLFVYSPDAPRGPRLERESMPAAGMGGKGPAAGGMTPAMTPAKAAGMGGTLTPAKPAPAAGSGGKEAVVAEGETITAGETLRSRLLDLPAPAFATKTPDGKDISLADFKGKVVMLDFWATWCGPCMQAIPAVQRLSEQFKDQPVAIVGVNRDKAGDESKVRKTIERKELTFHQAMDTPGAIAKTYKISAIPALILIDKEGVVRAVHVGYGPGEEKMLAAEIEKLLKGEKLPDAKP